MPSTKTAPIVECVSLVSFSLSSYFFLEVIGSS